MAAYLDDVLDRDHKTIGGVRDTEEKELMVRPAGWPCASQVVAIATPVPKLPKAVL